MSSVTVQETNTTVVIGGGGGSGSGGGDVDISAEVAARVAGDAANATAISAEAITRASADALLIPLSQKAANSGVASLDNTGKVPAAQLPALVLTHTYVVGGQSAMLSLTANVGDVAVRTDINESFILTSPDASQLVNWTQLLFPNSPVSSVNGRTGSVTGLAEATDVTTEATARATADALKLAIASDLADLHSASTARTNLGLGAAALLADPITVGHGGTGLTSVGAADTLLASTGSAPAYITAPQNLTGVGIGAVPSASTSGAGLLYVLHNGTQAVNLAQGAAARVTDNRTWSVNQTGNAPGNVALNVGFAPVVGSGVTVAQHIGLNVEGLPVSAAGTLTQQLGAQIHVDSAAGIYRNLALQWGNAGINNMTLGHGILSNSYYIGTGNVCGTLVAAEFNAGPLNFLGLSGLGTVTNLWGLLIGDGTGKQNTAMRHQLAGLVGIGGANATTNVGTQSPTVPRFGLHLMATSGNAGALGFATQSSTPTLSTASDASVYVKGGTFVVAYNDAGTTRYLSIALTGAGTTWTHGTTAP